MKTIDYSYFIERYIACEMDEKEKVWFEAELKDNSALRKDVDIRRKTDLILKNQDIINLRNKLAAIEKSRKDSKNVPISAKKRGNALKYAAIMTGIIILGSVILTSVLNKNADIDYGKYFSRYEPISEYRSEISEISLSNYDQGVYYYNNKDFEAAKKFFNLSIVDDPSNIEPVYYRGKSNYYLKNYSDAKPDFETVKDTNGSLYHDNAQWLLVDCYLNTNEIDLARASLSEIAGSESSYRKMAEKLLRDLNRYSVK